MSDKIENTIATKKNITSSIAQLFHLNCLATGIAVGVRLITHFFSETSPFPFFVDGCLMTILFTVYFFSDYKKLYPKLILPFVVIIQTGVLILWLVFNGMDGFMAPAYLLMVVLYALYIKEEPYRKIIIGLTFFSTLTALVFRFQLRWDSIFIIGKWIEYSMITLYITGTTAIILDFVNKRLEEERKTSEEKAKKLDLARQKAEQKRDLLEMLKDLQSDFFLEEDLKDAFNNLLVQLLKLTNSTFGFVGEVAVEDNNDRLKTHAFFNLAQNQETTVVYQNDTNQVIKGANLDLLFDYIMEYDTYVIANDPTILKQRGVSTEEINLKNFLGIAVTYNYKTVGVIGIANKEGGYNEELVNLLSPFLSTYGSIIQNIRLKRTQKEYENELKEAKDLAEYSNQLKSQFLTNISHELKTPLSLIMGPIDLLMKRSTMAMSPEELQSYLVIMQKNGNKMLSYIEDIMDLAKLNADKLTVSKNEIVLYDFIQSIYTLFETEVSYRTIDYRLEYKVNKTIVVALDAKKVEKILNNLLSNAFKYTKNGGSIILSVQKNLTGIEIKVQDTGIGIPLEHLPHIFNRFYQVKKENETIFSGTGVGLALTKELANIQGLKIMVDSILSKGSSFSFVLPDDWIIGQTEEPQIDENKPIEDPIAIVNDQKQTILVAEDNYDMRLFLKNVLGTEFNVELTPNGLEAFDFLKENANSVCLVITDLMMPEMDGLELLEEIKKASWGVGLPVIVLTAKTDKENFSGALRIGVDEYLTKPFSIDELMATIQNLLENQYKRRF